MKKLLLGVALTMISASAHAADAIDFCKGAALQKVQAMQLQFNLKCAAATQKYYSIAGHAGQTWYGPDCQPKCNPNFPRLAWPGGEGPCLNYLPVDPQCGKILNSCDALTKAIRSRIDACNPANRNAANQPPEENSEAKGSAVKRGAMCVFGAVTALCHKIHKRLNPPGPPGTYWDSDKKRWMPCTSFTCPVGGGTRG